MMTHIHCVLGDLIWLGGTLHGVGNDPLQTSRPSLMNSSSASPWRPRAHDLRHVVPFGVNPTNRSHLFAHSKRMMSGPIVDDGADRRGWASQSMCRPSRPELRERRTPLPPPPCGPSGLVRHGP